MRWIMLFAVVLGLAGAGYVILSAPSDADHAAATPRALLMEMSDPKGAGALDGLRFDTRMGLKGKPAELVDELQFDQGLFMSRECTDRCNYPPSAYLTRSVAGGTDFIVEAYCPTKTTTMIWRGQIRGDVVTGTVTWTSRRWYRSVTQVLSFDGQRSSLPVDMAASG